MPGGYIAVKLLEVKPFRDRLMGENELGWSVAMKADSREWVGTVTSRQRYPVVRECIDGAPTSHRPLEGKKVERSLSRAVLEGIESKAKLLGYESPWHV